MATDLIVRAGAGDEQAFGQLVEPYQRELQVHCYRILGSAQDAEDAVQAHSAVEQQLVARLTQAFEAADVDGIVALLNEDAWLNKPPVPLENQGRELAARFLSLAFRPGRRYRLVATRANGQPAFGLYLRDPHGAILHANGLIVLTLRSDQISIITRFDNSVIPRFGLPRSLPQ